ncbi:hypothetical protein EI94DRAFT_1752887 [Lactarius quietus]|nr:hypothetical protein EI94DRAFT_1752887 [Lactarius quietus]
MAVLVDLVAAAIAVFVVFVAHLSSSSSSSSLNGCRRRRSVACYYCHCCYTPHAVTHRCRHKSSSFVFIRRPHGGHSRCRHCVAAGGGWDPNRRGDHSCRLASLECLGNSITVSTMVGFSCGLEHQ